MSVLINFYGWSWKHWLLIIPKLLPFLLQRRQSQPRPNKIILIKRLRRSNNFPKGDQNGQKVKATFFTFRKTLPNVLRNRKRNLSFNIFRQKIVLKFKLAFLQFSLLLYFLFDKYLMTLKVVNVYLWVSLAFRDSWLLKNRGWGANLPPDSIDQKCRHLWKKSRIALPLFLKKLPPKLVFQKFSRWVITLG